MSTLSRTLLLILLGAVTLINWYGASRADKKLYYITKPFVLGLLLLFFALSGGLEKQNLPVLIAVFFSLLGDIFLIPKSTRWFIAGAIAFFITHLLYLFAFNRHAAPLLPSVIILAAAAISSALLSWYIWRETHGKAGLTPLRRLFIPYATVLIFMTASAILCLFRPAWPQSAAILVSLGGLLFLSSDGTLAAERMGKHIPQVRLLIIVTYHLAQFLIVAGFLSF